MKQIKSCCVRYFLLVLSMGLLAAAPAHAQELHIKITQSSDQAIPVAIVPFAGADGVPEDVAKIASEDLETTGLFAVLPRDRMLATPHSADEIVPANWRAVDTDNVVVGTIEDNGQGGYSIRFEIVNVYRGETLAGYEINASRAEMRKAAHALANLVYEQLTGEKGYFLSRIAYVAVTDNGGAGRYELVVADFDGHNPATIYSSPDPVMSPAWSPNGKYIAYVAFDVNRGLATMRVQEVATGEVQEISSRQGINGAPAWSPDGSRIAMTLSYEGNPDIYIYDLRSKQPTKFTHDSAIDTEATWSPDGRYIAFTSDRGGQPQIYRKAVSGGQAERLTFTGRSSQDAVYAPNGEQLAFVDKGPNGYRIAIKDLDSGDVRVVTNGPLDESPDFAPNGQTIIYATQGRQNALATVTVDGEVHTRLSQRGKVREPSWEPLQN